MATASRTPIYGEHVAAGAKLVDFAGWEMPLHYGSQIEEHQAVRRDAGVFDVSHMLVLDIEGEGARAFLRRALANDVARLRRPGKALYSCMLGEDGGILDDLIVYWLGGERYRAVVNAATGAGDLAWLERSRSGDVHIRSRRDLAMLAVQGPNAREKAWLAFPSIKDSTQPLESFVGVETQEMFVARTGYTGEDGFELLLPAERAAEAWRRLLAAGVRPCGLGARDTLRLEAGLLLYGQDMDAGVTPLECGLAWTVERRSDRDFVGQSALVSRPMRFQTLGLVLETLAGVLRSHQTVDTSDGQGVVTSGSYSPTLRTAIALARVPLGCLPGGRAQVSVRGKALGARIVKPRFVRHGRILV
ncbi:MAG TPA: glycine cleavage system aminomethyltransferase GcvT [Burkholderiales bacterium]|nr:glycine cleavage system aminomethyltransferase GcvT [Burkholderiales bacterium]